MMLVLALGWHLLQAPADPAPAEHPSVAAEESHGEPAHHGEDFARWLDQVEERRDGGDLEGARRHLAALVEAESYLALADESDEVALPALARLDGTAGSLGIPRIQHAAREERLRRLALRLPADHPEVVRARELFAGATYALGDLAGARELFGAVLTARERTLTDADPAVLRARGNLAVVLEATGDLAGARALQEALLASYERTLPADHPQLLRARGNLAVTLRTLGDLGGARALEESVLAGYERILPADHPDLVSARSNLAATLMVLGDLAGARALDEAVLASRERSLPADHPELLAARSNLASVLEALGDLAGARELQEAVLEGFERTAPADHPRLQIARTNLAATLLALGDLARARELFEAALGGFEASLPANHPHVLLARKNLAAILLELGELVRARELLEALLGSYEQVLPADHVDVLSARGNLAAVLVKMRDFSSARVLQESVLEGYERILSADDARVIDTRSNLAVTIKAMGDLAGARALQEAVLADYERILPADHPSVLLARGNLAATMLVAGDPAGARALQEAVLSVYEETFPADHPDLVRARASLAASKRAMGDLAGARVLLEAVLATYADALPPDHPDLLMARGNVASLLLDLGEHAGARALYEERISALEASLPADHPDVLQARGDLAKAMARLGALAEARALEEEVLAGLERALPADHPHVLAARQSLAVRMEATGDSSAARALYEEVLAARERTLPADHSSLLAARNNLAAAMVATGELSDARAIVLELERGLLRRLALVSTLSPREAREAAGALARLHAHLRFLSQHVELERPEALRFELAETLRATANGTAGENFADGGDPRRLELAMLRARLNDLVSGGSLAVGSSDSIAAEVSALVFERDRLERELRGELAAAGVAGERVTPAQVAQALPPGAAAVGFLRHEKWVPDREASRVRSAGDVLAAHVLRSDGTLAEVELGAADELAALAASWRKTLGAPVGARGLGLSADGDELATEPAAGSRLRRRVLDPVLELVGDADRIFVCLDDFLLSVPIEALPDGEGEALLGDRLRVVHELSFTRLCSSPPSPAGRPSALLLGEVAYDGEGAPTAAPASPPVEATRGGSPARFPPLRATGPEVQAVADQFWAAFEGEATLLVEEAASKAAFHQHAPGKRYLHVATHGWFAPGTVPSTLDARPEEDVAWSPLGDRRTVDGLAPMTLCGLAFAGANRGRDSLGRVPGILTAEELAGIDLSACELAVLSACETNVGIRRAGQGIQSLQTALHTAGARSAITSLWKVDDAATRKLFERFYTYLWVDGLSKADALWKAKTSLREEGHPVRDWAAWVLSGDPD